ncbi:hypothetical protein [Urbifossiella limnaea]|uniref:Uncharacterized protein n=1 Tax=Urbifossiella limnaea TaxID=2528023 RepID=A0A517XSV8_9BACT|nr:hypothetical protein [Urbifossiella limnaea]QDU20574.1 hypothetical protein ETAA1_25290 [Urbifossiella limnaea]
MSQYSITLSPNAWEHRPKAFKMQEKDWQTAAEVVRRRGYSPSAFAGLDRRSTKLFGELLGQALEQGTVPRGTHDMLGRLHTFLAGAGAGGFVITRGWAW